MKKTELKNLFLLFLAAAIWGSTFIAQSSAMDYVRPFTFLASRSYIGGFFLMLVIPILDKTKNETNPSVNNSSTGVKTQKLFSKEMLRGGFFAGLALLFAASLQQIGIQYTTVGKAGFLTALYVIFVPFFSFILFKKMLPKKIWLCVLLSVIGTALLCLKGSFKLQFGDTLQLLCAIGFSAHILTIDHLTEKLDPVRLSCIQFFVVAIFSTILMFLFEHRSISIILDAWFPICYAGFLSSGIAYTLQAVAQKKCDPTLASLTMCLESVFSAVFGWIILHETLSTKEIIGCGLMFLAIVLANLPEKQPKA